MIKTLLTTALAFFSFASTSFAIDGGCVFPSGLTDLTAFIGDSKMPGGMSNYLLQGTKGQTYEITCSPDFSVGATVTAGAMIEDAKINDNNSITYTINFTGFANGVDPTEGMNPGGNDGNCPQIPGGVPAGTPKPDGWPEQCPWPPTSPLTAAATIDAFGLSMVPCDTSFMPAEVCGVWMSTNVFEWTFTPPSQSKPEMGLVLNGPNGSTGQFRMFMPKTAIDQLSTYAGKELTAQDLALFTDGVQSGVSITATADGGALINVSMPLTPGNFRIGSGPTEQGLTLGQKTALQTKASSSSRKLTVGPKKTLSLAAKETTLKVKAKASFFGWKNGASNKTKVSLKCKYVPVKGKSSNQQFNLKTDSKGYFSKTLSASAKSSVTCQATSGTSKSNSVKVSFK